MPQTLTEIEVFAVGTWNGFKFTEEDLETIAKNTNALLDKGEHKPPVKLGHSRKQILNQEDGQPALGWLQDFKVQGKKLLATIQEVPDILIESIKKGLFRQISIEMDHIKHTGWIITGAAILGADLPAVKTLQDLSIYLSDSVKSLDTESLSLQFSEPQFLHGEKSMETNQTTTEDLKKFSEENQHLKEQLKQFQAKEMERQFSDAKMKIVSVYKEDVKAGKLAPAMLDKLEKHLDEQKAKFSEIGIGLTVSAELAREIALAYQTPMPAKETASNEGLQFSEDRADVKLEREIAKVMATSGKGYMDARKLAFAAQPGLLNDYRQFCEKLSFAERG